MHQPKLSSRTILSLLCGALLTLSSASNADPKGTGPVPDPKNPNPDPKSCERLRYNSLSQLVNCVTVEGVRQHQAAFQTFADANGNVRASGTPGYDESVDYVAARMASAGYNVTKQPFSFVSFAPLGPSTLEQTAPTPTTYVEDVDYTLMSQTDAGDVSGPVASVDLDLGPGNSSTSGCEPADYAGFPAGSIAIVQRGACSFQDKAENASNAGAIGVIIFNQGNSPDREGLINGTLSAEYSGGIPVVFATYALGESFIATPGLQLHMVVDVARQEVTTYNVIAESRGGNPNNVLMLGAHLDSVDEGPGIQDNGSGSAGILEVAEKMVKVGTRRKLRFAWWGAEESGLVGSDYYVGTLPAAELAKIKMYLNFDMIGSPNFVRFIYDGDGSEFGLAGPEGSAGIEKFFENWYMRNGLAYEPTEISFRSDYAAFFDNNIPFGGLFTGAEGIKTPEQQAIYGGTAGEQYDPCYHAACDTFDNISLEVLDQNTDAIAAATYWYAVLADGKKTGKRSGASKVPNKAKKTPKLTKKQRIAKKRRERRARQAEIRVKRKLKRIRKRQENLGSYKVK